MDDVRPARARLGDRAVLCGVLRAAPGPLQHQLAAELPPYAAGYFTGVPAPAAAYLVIMPMFAAFEWGDWIARSPYLGALWTAGVALLMISTLPTVSLKRFRIKPHFVVPTLLGIGILAAFLTTTPWPTLILIGIAYLGSIPLTLRGYRRRRQTAESRKGEPAETALPAPPYGYGEGTAPSSDLRH